MKNNKSMFEMPAKKSNMQYIIDSLENINAEMISSELPTTPLAENDLTLEEIKIKYGLQSEEIVLRLWTLKIAIRNEKQRSMNYDELIAFLKRTMNYGDMQMWLMNKQIEGIELTLNDKLKKFFELKSNKDILDFYDIEQNYNQNNIRGIKKKLEKETKLIGDNDGL